MTKRDYNPKATAAKKIVDEIYVMIHRMLQVFADNNTWEDAQLGFVIHNLASKIRGSEFTADTCCGECFLHLNFEGKYKNDQICCVRCNTCINCVLREGVEL